MWILPKQLHTSHFVPDTEALILDSNEQSQLCAQSLLVRSKVSPVRTWLLKWKRDSWTAHLSGRILKPSHGKSFAERWASSLGDFLVSPFPQQESDKETKTQDTSSLTFWRELDNADLPLFSLKMLKESSAQNSQETDGEIQQERLFCSMSSENWNEWVTNRRREYSLRAKSAHHTRESGCSSWPSASSRDWKDTPGMAREATDWDGSHRNRTDQLARAVYGEEFPLPQTADLTKKQENLGTPVQSAVLNTAEIANALVQPKMNTITRSLTECFTPEKNKHGPPAPANPSTDGSRPESWATPNGRDWKDNGTTLPPSIGETRGFSLGQQMVMTPTPGKLNPRWVETLMGLPVGWVMPSCASPVTIAPTSCDSWEMVSYRPQQSEHSES